MALSFVPDIIGGLVKIATGWIDRANARKDAEQQAKLITIQSNAKIEEARAVAFGKLAENAQENAAAWEQIAAQQASASWKDEFWTVLLAVPLVASFVPWLRPGIEAGFATISNAPPWYLAAVSGAIAFAFANRHLDSMFKKRGPKSPTLNSRTNPDA
jgi:hypothetical protein